MAVCLAAGIATFAALSRIEPAYRAAASLRLEGRTLPADFSAAAAGRYTEDHLRSRYGSVVSGAEYVDDWHLAITDVAIDAEPGARGSISVAFEILVDAVEPRAAEREAREIAAAFLANDVRAADIPAVPLGELEAARRELAESAAGLRALENDLAAFGRDNAAALPDLAQVNEQAVRQAEQERASLDQQIAASEARRIELDRALGDMQREAADYRADGEPALTGEVLGALQARWAVLRGRYGEDHADAIALGAEIAKAQASVAQRLDAVSTELREARTEFGRLERAYPIDHPDAVRLAHRVSALEARAAELRVTGLTNSERAHIEGLARERRDIDRRIAELRDASASLGARMDDHRSRAERAPSIQAQYRDLEAQVDAARDRHDRASASQGALEARLEAARNEAPGELSIVATPPAQRLPLSRPAVVIALGVVAGLLALVLVLMLAERTDRRIAGSAAVLRVQGSLPLAEIPVLS